MSAIITILSALSFGILGAIIATILISLIALLGVVIVMRILPLRKKVFDHFDKELNCKITKLQKQGQSRKYHYGNSDYIKIIKYLGYIYYDFWWATIFSQITQGKVGGNNNRGTKKYQDCAVYLLLYLLNIPIPFGRNT